MHYLLFMPYGIVRSSPDSKSFFQTSKEFFREHQKMISVAVLATGAAYFAFSYLHEVFEEELNYNTLSTLHERKFHEDMEAACTRIAIDYRGAKVEDLVRRKTGELPSYHVSSAGGEEISCYSRLKAAACESRRLSSPNDDDSTQTFNWAESPWDFLQIPADNFSPFVQKVLSNHFRKLALPQVTASLGDLSSVVLIRSSLTCS